MRRLPWMEGNLEGIPWMEGEPGRNALEARDLEDFALSIPTGKRLALSDPKDWMSAFSK